MLRSRIIPCLLVHDKGLVKTVKFKDPKYVGDPLNAVKIFNEKKVDELIVLDIDASASGRKPDFEMIKNIAAECRMPLCYGGGITTADEAVKIVSLGVEKVAISSSALVRPELIKEMASAVGSQSVVVVLDIKKKGILSRHSVYSHNGSKKHNVNPFEFAKKVEELGAGELVINSIDNDGIMKGYDIPLAQKFREEVSVPITILGGSGGVNHMEELIRTMGVVGAAAGSQFVFKGPYRAVLINYTKPNHP